VREGKTPTPPIPFVAIAEAGTAAPPVEAFVNRILVLAHEQRATFISIEDTTIQFLIDNEWEVAGGVNPPYAPHFVRRLGVMIGVLPPKQDRFVAGKLRMRIGDVEQGFLVRLDRDDDHGLTAIVELVDLAELAKRDSPRIPSNHPFR
jgi:hypothetical protein